MNEDLKWLAENVHEWDGRFDMVCRSALSFSCGPEWFNSKHFDGKHGYTRAQWQAARDELSGKPGWDDAPEWAQWLAQDDSGNWHFYINKPEPLRSHMWNAEWPHKVDRTKYGEGLVLGDWRSTLERRPMSVKQAFEKMRNIGEFDVEKSLAYTNCDASTEWRGPEDGLPPVGVECEWRSFDDGDSHWISVKIIAIHECAYWMLSDDGYEIDTTPSNHDFRPIRTEEDKAVEELADFLNCGPFSRNDQHAREIAEALYKKGYRKQESE